MHINESSLCIFKFLFIKTELFFIEFFLREKKSLLKFITAQNTCFLNDVKNRIIKNVRLFTFINECQDYLEIFPYELGRKKITTTQIMLGINKRISYSYFSVLSENEKSILLISRSYSARKSNEKVIEKERK